MSKKQRQHLLRLLDRLKAAVNKYDIQYIAMDLSAYSGDKLRLIMPEMLDLLRTASIRYTLSGVTDLITKTGRSARQAVPIYMERLLITDQWLTSGYRYALEQLGWAYKTKPDELAAYVSELEAVIEADDNVIANREQWLRQLAVQVKTADISLTEDDVLKLLKLNTAMSPNVYNAITWSSTASDEMKDLAKSLSNLNQNMNRRTVLQNVIDSLSKHSKTGWQSYQELYSTFSDFLNEHKVVKQVKLFGSRANNTYRADSDIDIALVLKANNPQEAIETYRQHSYEWEGWFAKHLPYKIDLNLYIDEDATPEIHNALSKGTHSTYG